MPTIPATTRKASSRRPTASEPGPVRRAAVTRHTAAPSERSSTRRVDVRPASSASLLTVPLMPKRSAAAAAAATPSAGRADGVMRPMMARPRRAGPPDPGPTAADRVPGPGPAEQGGTMTQTVDAEVEGAEPPELAAFRAQVRAFLDEHAPVRQRRSGEDDGDAELGDVATSKRFQAALFDAGLAGLTWPQPWGQGLTSEHTARVQRGGARAGAADRDVHDRAGDGDPHHDRVRHRRAEGALRRQGPAG